MKAKSLCFENVRKQRKCHTVYQPGVPSHLAREYLQAVTTEKLMECPAVCFPLHDDVPRLQSHVHLSSYTSRIPRSFYLNGLASAITRTLERKRKKMNSFDIVGKVAKDQFFIENERAAICFP